MAGENAQLMSFTDRTYSEFRVTLAGAVTKGDVAVRQNQVGFYLEDGAIGDLRAFVFEANRAKFPKATGVAFTPGDDLFFDDVNLNLTKNNAFRPVGVAEEAAASDATTAIFRFHQEAAGTY